MKILSTLKKVLGLPIVLPFILFFQCQKVDSLTEDDPISSMIMTLKADNEMLDVFIDKVLSDPQFENKFLHHPWMIESLGRDSVFVNKLIKMLHSDSTNTEFLFNQLALREGYMEGFIKRLYAHEFIDERGRDYALRAISEERVKEKLNK